MTQKEQAVLRMKTLKLDKSCIKAFNHGEVWLSEQTGGLYEFSDNKFLVDLVKKFEKKYNAVVYHVIHTYTNFGELYNLLYVSNDKEEWEQDMEDIADGYVFVWCENVDEPMFSEFGTIGVASRFGGLVRSY